MVDVEKIRTIAERVAVSEGFDWVEVELKGGRSNPLLRIYIDKPEGVSHADCQDFSEQMSALLDVEDPFPGSYLLEVSSPGLDRKLVKPGDFEHFAGRKARLVVRGPAGSTQVLDGRLAGFTGGRVKIETGSGEISEFDLADVLKARLVVEP
ncbi:MAG TPA: ribosome maturation factor RimP [Terriglobia bacterium]|nr:ribosome maturation factor RimP [Terriglobia bacterium]